MDNDIKQYIGQPIDVETGSITPITYKPIDIVDASKWHEMTISELYDQKAILGQRLVMANQIGNYSILQQIQSGMALIDEVIESKSGDGEDLKLV